MSVVKWMVAALAMVVGGASGLMVARADCNSVGAYTTGAGPDLQYTWWSTENDVCHVFTWAQPGRSDEMRTVFWQPVEEQPLMVTFSEPEPAHGLRVAWSNLGESTRQLLFTWSNPAPAAMEEGAAGGEPRAR